MQTVAIDHELAVRAYDRLAPEDQDVVRRQAARVAGGTRLPYDTALAVLAAIGKYLVEHDRGHS